MSFEEWKKGQVNMDIAYVESAARKAWNAAIDEKDEVIVIAYKALQLRAACEDGVTQHEASVMRQLHKAIAKVMNDDHSF